VVDEELLADLSAGVNLDASDEAADVSEDSGRHFQPLVMKGVRRAVDLASVKARIGKYDFDFVDGGRVTFPRGLDVSFDTV
jgi:hypothetical protein